MHITPFKGYFVRVLQPGEQSRVRDNLFPEESTLTVRIPAEQLNDMSAVAKAIYSVEQKYMSDTVGADVNPYDVLVTVRSAWNVIQIEGSNDAIATLVCSAFLL